MIQNITNFTHGDLLQNRLEFLYIYIYIYNIYFTQKPTSVLTSHCMNYVVTAINKVVAYKNTDSSTVSKVISIVFKDSEKYV